MISLPRRLGLERISSPSLIGIRFANDTIEIGCTGLGRQLACQGRRDPVVHGGNRLPLALPGGMVQPATRSSPYLTAVRAGDCVNAAPPTAGDQVFSTLPKLAPGVSNGRARRLRQADNRLAQFHLLEGGLVPIPPALAWAVETVQRRQRRGRRGCAADGRAASERVSCKKEPNCGGIGR